MDISWFPLVLSVYWLVLICMNGKMQMMYSSMWWRKMLLLLIKTAKKSVFVFFTHALTHVTIFIFSFPPFFPFFKKFPLHCESKILFFLLPVSVLNKLKAVTQTNTFHHTVKKACLKKWSPGFVFLTEKGKDKSKERCFCTTLGAHLCPEAAQSTPQWFVVKGQSLGGINQRPKDKKQLKRELRRSATSHRRQGKQHVFIIALLGWQTTAID